MSHRSSSRVESCDANYLVGAGDVSFSRDDSIGDHTPHVRVRAELADRVIGGLGDRERAIVANVNRLRVMSGGQLLRLHFPGDPNGKRHGQRVLRSLVDHRVLARLRRRIGGVRAGSQSYIYRVDVVGQRLVDPLASPNRRWELGESFLRHALMVSECYSVLVEAERAGLLELLHFEAEPACWRSFVGRRGSSEVLKPDSLVRVGLADYEDHWFLECDRSTEDLGRIGRKIGGYIRYWQAGKEDPFPRVLWVCARPERAGALAGVVRRLPPDQRRLFATCHAELFLERVRDGANQMDPN